MNPLEIYGFPFPFLVGDEGEYDGADRDLVVSSSVALHYFYVSRNMYYRNASDWAKNIQSPIVSIMMCYRWA